MLSARNGPDAVRLDPAGVAPVTWLLVLLRAFRQNFERLRKSSRRHEFGIVDYLYNKFSWSKSIDPRCTSMYIAGFLAGLPAKTRGLVFSASDNCISRNLMVFTLLTRNFRNANHQVSTEGPVAGKNKIKELGEKQIRLRDYADEAQTALTIRLEGGSTHRWLHCWQAKHSRW